MNPVTLGLILLLGLGGLIGGGQLKKRGEPKVQAYQPTPTPTPTPTPPYEENIHKGFEKYGAGREVPMATMSAQLAELGQQLPNPYLPAALALKESSGLVNTPENQRMRAYSNPFGIKDIGGLVRYPNLQTAIMGGGNRAPGGTPQMGLKGTLLSDYYKDYRQSGNLEDFLRVYTPPGGTNASMQTQLAVLKQLLSYFGGGE